MKPQTYLMQQMQLEGIELILVLKDSVHSKICVIERVETTKLSHGFYHQREF
jgi:hypothetical protein